MIVVRYLRRVDAEKNVEALSKAFQDVESPEDTKLLVVGGGSERRRLERRFSGKRVHFTGQVLDESERIAMLRAMDIFVLPSVVEGLSLSLLEAMACGAASIATDVGSDGEALRGAGLVLDPREIDGQLRLGPQTPIDYPEFRADPARRCRARAGERYRPATHHARLRPS